MWQLVNAADYGAAQTRHRVLIFGIRDDVGVQPEKMTATHSRDRLLWDQFVTGEYWTRHGLKARKEAILAHDRRRVADLKKLDVAPATQPWLTVRDALLGLGEPDGLPRFFTTTFAPATR